MKISIGMAVALMCIALLVGVIAALVSGWLAHKSGANTTSSLSQASSAFAVTTCMVLAVFTFLGLTP